MIEIDYALEALIALRTVMVQLTNVVIVTMIMHQSLYKRNTYKILICWQLFRSIFINGILTIVLEDIRFNNPMFQNIYALVYCIATYITVITYLYTYKNQVNTLFLFFICEFPAVLLSIGAMTIVGWIEGRASNYLHPFIWMDLLIPLIELGVAVLFIKRIQKKLNRFRDYELRHPSIWIFVTMVYIIPSSLMTAVTNMSIQVTNQIKWSAFSIGVVFTYLLVDMYLFWQKKVRFQNDYLRRQRELQVIHYKVIQCQIMKMEFAQKEIDRQMETLQQIVDSEDADDKIVEYLKSLKQKREDIQAGVFCDDWVVDSILFYYSNRCKQLGINLDVQLQKYYRGKITDEEISEIFIIIFENLLKKRVTDKVILNITRVRNYLVIKISEIGGKHWGSVTKKMKRYVEKNNGTIQEMLDKEGNRFLEIVMQAD